MNIKKHLITVFFLPFIGYSQVIKQDTSAISEVVISENRLQIPFSKQSRNIQIIDKGEIQNLPVRSINEVLSYISGVDVRQRGAFGTQADISIDGGLFDQTLILLNGIKISDIQTGHHSMNIPVSLDAVERIEVLKGPAARIYGINALTGAINIITKVGDVNNVSVHVQTGSSFQTKEEGDGSGIYVGGMGQAILHMGSTRFRNLLSLGYSKTNGMRYNSKTQDKKIYYQGKYKVNEINELEFMLGYIDNEFGANGYYAAPGDRESYELVKTFIGSVGSINRLSERFVLKPRISYRNNKDDYRYFRNELSKARSEHETDAIALEVNSVLHTNLGDFGFGVESRSEEIKSSNIGNHQRYNHGLFAEYKMEAIQKLYLNVGMYANYNTQYGWQLFPGIDASYAFLKDLKVSFNIGTSQRLPSYTDLYLKQPKNIGNSNLNPEEAWQYEFSIRYSKKEGYVQAGYFKRRINEFIDWVSDSSDLVFQAQNLGNNRIEGLNISAGYLWKLRQKEILKLDVFYNYLNPKTQLYAPGITSKYILESLKHQAVARINYHYNKVHVGMANRWVKREMNKAYFIADLRAGYDIAKWNIFADVNNIFDASYAEVGTILLPKRWVSVGVKWNMNL